MSEENPNEKSPKDSISSEDMPANTSSEPTEENASELKDRKQIDSITVTALKGEIISENKTELDANDDTTESDEIVTPVIRRPLSLELLEAVFFAAGRPLTVHRIASEFGGWKPKEIRKLVRKLANKLEESKSELKLKEVQRDRWILHLPLEEEYPSRFLELVQIFLLRDFPKNAYHSVENRRVLTSIAFHQPVSQAKLWKLLSNISGDETWLTIPKLQTILDSLVKEGLISANMKMRPIQFKTTKLFADEWGFDSTKKNLKQQLLRRLDLIKLKKPEQTEQNLEELIEVDL